MSSPVLTRSPEGFTVSLEGEVPETFDSFADARAFLATAAKFDWTAALEAAFGYEDEGPTCSICDGLGHGYPGGRPCPLEDRGYSDGADGVWR